MKLLTTLTTSSLIALSVAAPHARLEERQRDVTFTITCLRPGPDCSYPPTSFPIPTTFRIPSGLPVPGPTTTQRVTPTPSPTPSSSRTTPRQSSSSRPVPPSSSSRNNPPPSSSRFTPPVNTPTRTTRVTSPPTRTEGGGTPSNTGCPIALYYQCGGYLDGKPWSGCTECASGATCVVQNDYYHQCVAEE